MRELISGAGRYLWQVLLNLRKAAAGWCEDDAGLLAAGVAFYATVSLVPLLLVLIAGFSLFLRYTSLGLDVELEVVAAIEAATSSEVANSVSIALGEVEDQAVVSGPLSLIGLLIAALAVFSRFDRALELIWKTDRRKRDTLWATARDLALHRLKAFAALLGLGLVVLAIFSADMALAAVSKFSESRFPIWQWIWHVAKIAVSIGLNACVFGLIYRLLGRSTVDWRRALRGGLLAAVTWEAGRLVLAEFLIDDRYTAYGIVGSLLVLMLWAYYATSVLLLGAEYVVVIRGSQPTRLRVVGHGLPEAIGAPPATSHSRPPESQAADGDPPEPPQTLRFQQLEHGFRRWRPGRRATLRRSA